MSTYAYVSTWIENTSKLKIPQKIVINVSIFQENITTFETSSWLQNLTRQEQRLRFLFLDLCFQYSIFYEDGSDESEATSSGTGSIVVSGGPDVGQDTPAALLVKAAEAEARNSASANDEQALNASLVAQEVGNEKYLARVH